eukprot:2050228-Pyramimonas_sp.AAC.3
MVYFIIPFVALGGASVLSYTVTKTVSLHTPTSRLGCDAWEREHGSAVLVRLFLHGSIVLSYSPLSAVQREQQHDGEQIVRIQGRLTNSVSVAAFHLSGRAAIY